MKEWHTAKEIAGINSTLGIEPGTPRGVTKKALSEQWSPSRPRAGRGGGREYHVNALPEETRVAILTAAIPETAPADSSAPPDSEAVLEAYASTRRITLSPAQLADPVIQAKLAVARAIDACPAYMGREKLIATLAARYGKSPMTIRRWRDDIEAMETKTTPRITLGETKIELPRSNAFSDEAIAYGLSIYAKNIRAGVKAAYRAMAAQAGSRQWTMGDYSSFTRLVKQVPEMVWIYIRKGPTGFELQCVPKIIQKWTAVPCQSVLCGDQKVFDYEIYDAASSRIIIPNGYFWMDCSSRAIVGAWVEMGHYNSYTVGSALREAMRYGISDEIFTDWGKPETSKHLAHMLRSLSGISVTGDFVAMNEKYGNMDEVEHRKAQPGKPWMKPIENVMNILDTRMSERFLGGFRKRNNDAWVNKVIQARLKKDRKITMSSTRPASASEARGLMSVEQFVQTVFSVVQEHNKSQKQLKEGGSIIPEDFFTAGITRQPKKKLADRTLDYIFMPHKDVMPRQSVVYLQARSDDYRGYRSTALATIKEKVRVSFNPYDPDAVAVITDIKSGDIIDIGEPWHSQDRSDREGTSAKRKRQAEIMRWVAENARRVKEAFDIKIEDAREPGDAAPIEVIGPASAVAQEAQKVTRLYELKRDNDRLIEKEHTKMGRDGVKDLIAEMEDHAFRVPKQSKERYRLWCMLDLDMKKGVLLSEEEEEFHTHYQKDTEWRIHRENHEEWGTDYIDIKITPDALQVVK